ncbi:MAG TPA: hypothetical protein VN026_15730 [Bacteroidia bacterium]|jgi:hypothetical protein|nr:hypothetical protein [Bacteroidia bacterium]
MSLDEDNIFDDPDDDEFERLQKRKKNLPVFKKALEIAHTVNALNVCLKGRDKEMYAHHLSESSLILGAKIAGAVGSGSWLIAMQNAAIVRYHAEWLLTATSGLKTMTKADKDYIKVLRNEMEEFRDLFNEWVKEIHKMDKDDFEDEWGLFIK